MMIRTGANGIRHGHENLGTMSFVILVRGEKANQSVHDRTSVDPSAA